MKKRKKKLCVLFLPTPPLRHRFLFCYCMYVTQERGPSYLHDFFSNCFGSSKKKSRSLFCSKSSLYMAIIWYIGDFCNYFVCALRKAKCTSYSTEAREHSEIKNGAKKNFVLLYIEAVCVSSYKFYALLSLEERLRKFRVHSSVTVLGLWNTPNSRKIPSFLPI